VEEKLKLDTGNSRQRQTVSLCLPRRKRKIRSKWTFV